MSFPSTIIGGFISIVVFALLYRPFFGKENDFWECVKYFLKPNFVSLLEQDLWKSLKFWIFINIVIFSGIFGGYIMVESMFK